MYLIPIGAHRQASPLLRDKFLIALDRNDPSAIDAAARDLLGCVNALPGDTCTLLGLPHGSTYGDAADVIAARSLPRPDAA